jgi:hypothetical protein
LSLITQVARILESVIPPLVTDRETVALIAGDLRLAHRQGGWLRVLDVLAVRFLAIVKTIVVTHHGISPLSIHERYRGDSLNWAFMSELSKEIMGRGPDLWVHGHTHDSFDYLLGRTRVVVNPYGYQDMETIPRYNSGLLIELGTRDENPAFSVTKVDFSDN